MTINVFEVLWLVPSIVALILALRNLREARADWHAAGCNGEANKVIARSHLITHALRAWALTVSSATGLYVSSRLEVHHETRPSEWAVIVALLTFVLTMLLLNWNDAVTRRTLNAMQEADDGEH